MWCRTIRVAKSMDGSAQIVVNEEKADENIIFTV